MEGNERLSEMKMRQRQELQIKRQNHLLMRMAGKNLASYRSQMTSTHKSLSIPNRIRVKVLCESILNLPLKIVRFFVTCPEI